MSQTSTRLPDCLSEYRLAQLLANELTATDAGVQHISPCERVIGRWTSSAVGKGSFGRLRRHCVAVARPNAHCAVGDCLSPPSVLSRQPPALWRSLVLQRSRRSLVRERHAQKELAPWTVCKGQRSGPAWLHHARRAPSRLSLGATIGAGLGVIADLSRGFYLDAEVAARTYVFNKLAVDSSESLGSSFAGQTVFAVGKHF